MGPVDCKAKAFMSRTHPTEHQEQCAFFEYVRFRALSDSRFRCIAATPNAAKRSPLMGLRMVKEGMEAGFPDVSVLVANDKFHGLFIEFKVKPNRVTEHQARWLRNLAINGYYTVVCWSATEAIDLIEKYLDNKL